MPSQTVSRLLLATLAVVLSAAPASAQIVDLNPVIPTKSVIGASEQSEIDSFVADQKKRIDTGETAAITQSRNALLKPLESPNVTRAFRQAYGTTVLPVVQSLVGSDDTVRVMAGLRLAGKLGTDEATQLLLERMPDPDEGIRFFVVTSLGDTLASLASTSASLSTETATDAIKALGDVIRNDENATFADAAVRALIQATGITQPALATTRSLVIVTLAESVGDRLHQLRAADSHANDEMIAALRACIAIRDAVSIAQLNTSPAAATAAVRLGADGVGYVFSRVRSGAMAASGTKEHEVALVAAGESVILFGRQKLGETTAQPTDLSTLLKGGNEREFNFRVSELIGPESAIVSNLGFDRDRFIRPADDD